MNRCWHCKNETPAAHYERVVYNKTALHAEWSGWRMTGRFLIGPHSERFTPERLAAIAASDASEKRVCNGRIVVPLKYGERRC